MCFIIHDAYPNLLIAKKDIVCYKKFKIDERSVVGYYQTDFLWWDKRRKTETVHKKAMIDIWGHSIYGGIHSYSCKKRLPSTDFSRVCIIPKGATYYYNSYHQEYVSNELIVYINKKVYPKND